MDSYAQIFTSAQTAAIEAQRRRFEELKRELQQLQYFCKGTHDEVWQGTVWLPSDPTSHGPYFEWTYKDNGKTVNVKLTRETAPLYQAASGQYRKLKTVLNRLERLSQTGLGHQAKLAQSTRRNG